MVDSVYGLLAHGTIGDRGKGLVDEKLVPTHVAADVDAAASEMIASLTMLLYETKQPDDPSIAGIRGYFAVLGWGDRSPRV